MKRILFVIIPEKGHIHPYIGPAEHLRRRGHTVAFYAALDVSRSLRRAGFDQFFAGQGGEPAETNRGQYFAEKVRDRDWLRRWIRELLVERVPGQVEALRAVVKQFRPDVLAVDPMVYQGAIVAEQERLPWAGLSSSLNPVVPDSFQSELLETNRWLGADRDALFARYGVRGRFRVCDCLSPHLNIVFSTVEFVGAAPPEVHLVGPSLPSGRRGDECAFPWERLRPDWPVVYMSLGSQIYYQPAMFRTAIGAVAGRPVQLVLSVSDLLHSDELGPLPDNVLAARYVPQLQMLRRSAAFITHGGANSLMEALAAGVPLLISPICNDQFHNARFIVGGGVGLERDLNTVSAEQCWTALSALLGPGPYRDNALRVQSSYQSNDGAATAARLMEELSG